MGRKKKWMQCPAANRGGCSRYSCQHFGRVQPTGCAVIGEPNSSPLVHRVRASCHTPCRFQLRGTGYATPSAVANARQPKGSRAYSKMSYAKCDEIEVKE